MNDIEVDIYGFDYDDDGYEFGLGCVFIVLILLFLSINDYMFENNWCYYKFKEGRYLFFNDEVE